MNIFEQQVLELIGENTSSPDVFSDSDSGLAPIRDSINDAIQELSIVTGAYKQTYLIPLRKDQTFYKLKFTRNQFGWVTDAWHVDRNYRLAQTDLLKECREDPRWLLHSSDPIRYMQVGLDIIGVSPKSSADTGTLQLTCVIIPDEYSTSADRIKLRDSFRWAVVHYAVGEFYAGRGDKREAMNHHNEFLKKLGMQALYPESTEYQYKAKQ